MITVTIQQKQNEIRMLKVKGHAEAGPYGNDLVCAGVSSILYGGLNALDQLANECCDLIVKENEIQIQVKKACELTQTIIQTIVIQLKTIEERYKDYIIIR